VPGSLSGVVGLRRRFQLIGNVYQILGERPQGIRADVAAQRDLAIRRDSDDE
jgi:hypothetical protein